MCRLRDRTTDYIEQLIKKIGSSLRPRSNGCDDVIQLALLQGFIDQGESLAYMSKVSEAEEARAEEIQQMKARTS